MDKFSKFCYTERIMEGANEMKKNTLVVALSCAGIVLLVALFLINGKNTALNSELQEKSDTIEELSEKNSSLTNRVDELQSKLDVYDEIVQEMDGLQTNNLTTQEIYEEGWMDACDNYGIDVGREDVPDYGYYGKMTD